MAGQLIVPHAAGWVKPGNSGRIKRIKREEYGRNKAAQVGGLRDAEQGETRGCGGSCMQRTLQLGVRLCFSHARRPRLVFGGPLGLGRGAGVVGGGARARGRAVWRRRRGGGLQDGHLAMAVPGSFPCSSRWRIRGRLGRSGDFRRSRAVSVGVFSVRVRRFPRKDGGVGREKLGQFGLVQGNGDGSFAVGRRNNF